MAETLDQELIRDYSRNGAEASFGELVHHHLDLVYSTAFRVLRNPNLAEEVSQRVFVALARNARKLEGRAVLTGWLHQTARNFAVEMVRNEERRRRREREATEIGGLGPNEAQSAWDQIAPHLDGALAQLGVDDREAILLRYFERKTAKEIGERLGLTEEAAQKRATRALDRLRSIFAERGIATPTAGLATLLSLQAVQSAPLGLTASVIAAGAAETLTTSLTGLLMASTKLKIGLAAALAAAATLPLVIQYQTNNRLLGEITALKSQGTELSRLREELQRVSAESQLLAEQRERERTELARLRGELAAIKGRKNQTAGAPHGANPAQPAGQGDESKSGPLVPRDQWRNVGFQIPSATVQTLEWAKVGGDTNVVANALAWADANSRAGVEAIFAAAPESVRAKYGSADQYVLSLFDHSGPMDDRHNLLSYRILAESIDGDQAVLRLEYHYADGSTPVADQRYIRIGNEWRMALDFDAPSRGKMTSSLQSEGDSTPP